MKYFAILKDSLRETIDSKVLVVVLAISLLSIAALSTLTLKPNSPADALQQITARFPDGAQEVDVPLLGKMKATPSFTKYSVENVEEPPENAKPWEAEYQFDIEARDLVPAGTRIAMLDNLLRTEDTRERLAESGKVTRIHQINEEVRAEAERIQQRAEKKGKNDLEAQQELQQQLLPFIRKRLEEETRSLTTRDMEQFLHDQLENQGNWRVLEVQEIQLPAAERTVKLKVRVPVQEGEDVRIKMEDAEGEIRKFRVKVVSRDGTYNVWPHKATFLFGAIPLGNSEKPGELVYKITHWMVGIAGSSIILLLACIITAFYIPNMLRKGTIDLLLAKPISRVGLFTYKYIGGLTFIFLNTTVLVFGLWLALGLRSGIWQAVFLYTIPILTFEFALFYAFSTLAAVLTRSAVASILICVMVWAGLFVTGWLYWAVVCQPELNRASPQWLSSSVSVLHTALPHYLDLDWLADKSIKVNSLSLSEGEQAKLAADGYNKLYWSESLVVSSLYIVFLLFLSCWRFATRDY